MLSMEAKKTDRNEALAKITVEISDMESITVLINKLKQIKGITEVKRAKSK